MNKNCLSYWFPLIESIVPVPRTEIVRSGDMTPILDGEIPDGWHDLLDRLNAARVKIGGDCFLRTGQGSGKHHWSETCFLPEGKSLASHVVQLIEWSAMVDLLGLPSDVWCVREILLTSPVGVCEDYSGMPVCREFRFFAEAGVVKCFHPYWPLEALNEGGLYGDFHEGWYDEFCRLDDPEPKRLAELVSAAVSGAWSIDILESKRGWFVTDMAEAARSFHWEGCLSLKEDEAKRYG
jgi:hypothetical protein